MKKKIEYIDFLRVLATIAVILLHVSAHNYYNAEAKSLSWHVFNFCDGISRWAVPVFVMISGALFLDREKSLKRIFTKNITRLAAAFLFWSFVYALVNLIESKASEHFLAELLKGHYHMWFLFMIAGLYIIVPFLQKIAASSFLLKYFLVLSLMFTFIFPFAIKIISYLSPGAGDAINTCFGNTKHHFTIGYIFYFMLGYYLSKAPISKKTEIIIYILGTCGFFCAVKFSNFYDFSISVLFESIGVFVFAKNHISFAKYERLKKIISKLSKYSFGIYLMHALFIEQIEFLFGINTLSFNPLISVPIITAAVFIISLVLSAFLNSIPVLKKYIV